MASNVLELPHISRVRNSDEFFGLMYERNPETKKNEMLAYLNQRGMIDYDKVMICRCGCKHLLADELLGLKIQTQNSL